MPLFNTKAVVHRTNVPAPTLRAWERRYGILSPRRGDNDYRLYSERDIATIKWLRERVQSGMTISQAIALLKSLDLGQRSGRKSTPSQQSVSNGYHLTASISVPPAPAPAEHFAVDQMQTSLLRHVADLDEQGIARTLAQALAIYSIEDVCLDILTPALHEMGRRWAAGELGTTVEHFGTMLIRAQLESLFRSAFIADDGPVVFVGCAPGELHELGPLMLALFLRRGGFHVVYLGQNVDEQSLIATAVDMQPAAVLLSAAQPAAAARLTELSSQLHAQLGSGSAEPVIVVGGQAFEQHPELVSQVTGAYLGADTRVVVSELRRRLSA